MGNPADELIDTGRPFVMVLVGLSNITDPLRQLPAVLEIINTVEDPVTRERLKTVFYACIESEEIIDVVKELIKEKDAYDLDTAGIRWMLKEHDKRVIQPLRAEYAAEIAQLKQQAEQRLPNWSSKLSKPKEKPSARRCARRCIPISSPCCNRGFRRMIQPMPSYVGCWLPRPTPNDYKRSSTRR
ncbi:MAG: hypothetical protein HC837_16420 [Chloroflexaceae bacterium]|nr:hypothetical protein [Chloroflexaceae bacterium]